MLEGIAGAALLKVFAPLLEAIFNAFGKSFNDWLAGKRAEQAQRDLGASQVTAKINKEAADDEREAAAVATNQPDVGPALNEWANGKPF